MAGEEQQEQRQPPGAQGESPTVRFVPDTRRQAAIARFRKWALLSTLALLVYGFVLLLRADRRTQVGRPSAGNAASSVTASQPEPVSVEMQETPVSSAGAIVGPSSGLLKVASLVASIDSLVRVTVSRWQQTEEVWQLANSPTVSAGEGLSRVLSAQAQAETAAAEVRIAGELARQIVLLQSGAELPRTRLGELYSAELSMLAELDSLGASRRRQLKLIEQAFRSLRAGDSIDFYVKIENPAGSEQRRAEVAMKRLARAQWRLEQALRSLGLLP